MFQLETPNDGSGRHVSFALSLVVVLEHVSLSLSLSLAHHDGPESGRERGSERGSVKNSGGAEGVLVVVPVRCACVCVTVCASNQTRPHGVLGTYATGYDTILTGCVTLTGDDNIRVRSFSARSVDTEEVTKLERQKRKVLFTFNIGNVYK
jgi:hypothetical protein